MKSSPDKDLSQNQRPQARNIKPGKFESQQDSTVKTNALKNFIVGDWSQFNDIWETEDDVDTPTEKINKSPSPSLGLYPAVHIVESSEDHDEWLELEHDVADPKSSQPDSLASQLDVTSLSDFDLSRSESKSGYETDSSDESPSNFHERERLRAQRYLALRALYPQRRRYLEPRRKDTVFQPSVLSIRKQVSQAQSKEEPCPNCDNTVYRMVSDVCLLCVMESTRNTIYELESAQDSYDEGYLKEIRRISDRKCAIEDERPEDYEEDTEYQDLMNEFLERRKKATERRANVDSRVAELNAQLKQYSAWLDEDLAKFNRSKKESETPAFL